MAHCMWFGIGFTMPGLVFVGPRLQQQPHRIHMPPMRDGRFMSSCFGFESRSNGSPTVQGLGGLCVGGSIIIEIEV